MPILCFLTVRPPRLFYDFVCRLASEAYPVFITIDDYSYNIPGVEDDKSEKEHVTILKIDRAECEAAGFKGAVITMGGKACSRDKALFFFSRRFIEWEHVWFIEQDVFIPTEETITKIDRENPTGDLLVRQHKIVTEIGDSWWFRYLAGQITFPPLVAISMICAIRVSRALMVAIDRYASEHGTLFLDEALFNTLALQNSLSVATPRALRKIDYKTKWGSSDVDGSTLLHPVKDIQQQHQWREELAARRREGGQK